MISAQASAGNVLPTPSGPAHKTAAPPGFSRDDVDHKDVHFGGENVDQICLFPWQDELLLELGPIYIERHVGDMHPDMKMEFELERQNVGMNGYAPEQGLRHGGAGVLDLGFGVIGIALGGLAQIGAEDVAGHFGRQRARPGSPRC